MEAGAVDTGVSSEGMGQGAEGFEGEAVDFFTGEKTHAKYQKPRVFEPKKEEQKSKTKPVVYEDVAKQTQEESETPKEKYKLTIEGEEKEFTLDELLKTKSLEQASYKKMEQAAEAKKKADAVLGEYETLKKNVAKFENSHNILNNFVQEVQKDPSVIVSLVKNMGHDFDKIAEDHLYKKWQYSNLTDEQRDYLRLKEFETQTFAKHERDKAEAAKQSYESEKQTFASDLNGQFNELFKELGGRPDPLTLKLMIEQLHLAHKQKSPLSVKDAHARVQALQPQYREKWLSNIADADLKSLPKEFVKRIQEQTLAEYRAENVPGRKAAQAPAQEVERPSRREKPIIANDFFDELDRRRR